MATINYEVSAYRKADGTRLVKARVTHRRKTIRKPLGIYASDAQLTRDKTRIRDAALLDAVESAIDRLRMVAATVEGAEWMDVDELWRQVSARMEAAKGFSLDIFVFSKTVTAKMEKGTADGYRFAFNAFASFLGRDRCDVNEIDRRMVSGFREWIERRNGKGCRAASAYLEKLRHVHRLAREAYNDDDIGLVRIPRDPFRGQIPPQPVTAHRALTVSQLRGVLAFQPVTDRHRLAKDVFILSVCLIGMNTADIYRLRLSDINGGVVTYNRAKTDSRRDDMAIMKVWVEPEALEIMSRHPMGFGYSDFRGFNKAVNAGMKAIGESIGVPGLSSYYARHSWATIARNECGVPKDVVHEALNHASRGSDRVTDIYLARDWSRVWEANRRVLDLVFG